MIEVVEIIKSRLPITDILSTYITLTPAGSQFKAKCPFHNERTASFSVSPERGLYYCFGCGAKGDIFTFVQQFEGVDFKGSLKVLADRAGVELTKYSVKKESNDPLYEVLERATILYQSELQKNIEVLKYLQDRGINEQSIKDFRIGYTPNEWRYMAGNAKSDAESILMERVGLVKKTDKGYYDRFRGRIMFPLTDSSGRVVGFSGRIFDDSSEKDGVKPPKYLNSPETEVFQKSKILYGFDKAKSHIRNHGFSILVEGQIDVVLSHQSGFRNTVASSGTAVSEMSIADSNSNLSTLSRLSPNVLLAFDGDEAGQKALDRAAIVALALHMNPKVVPLPKGIDPADFLHDHSSEEWKEVLKQSKHFIIHQLSLIDKNNNSAHTAVSILKKRIFPFLVKIQSPIETNLYIEAIAKEFGIPKDDCARELQMFVNTMPKEGHTIQAEEKIDQQDTAPTLEERLIAFKMKYPEETKDYQEILDSIYFKNEKFIPKDISKDRLQIVTSTIERDYGNLEKENLKLVFKELSDKLREQFFESLRNKYTRELLEAEKESPSADGEEKVKNIMQSLHEINSQKHKKSET